jgi:hypothetical protein
MLMAPFTSHPPHHKEVSQGAEEEQGKVGQGAQGDSQERDGHEGNDRDKTAEQHNQQVFVTYPAIAVVHFLYP